MNEIFFKSDIIKSDLSDEAVFCYIALRGMDNQRHFICTAPIQIWMFMAGNDSSLSRYIVEKILSGLYELQDRGLISLQSAEKHHTHFIDTRNLVFQSGNSFFNCIGFDEIETLLNSSISKSSRFSLFRYYLIILSSFSAFIPLRIGDESKKYKVSNLSIGFYEKLSGLDRHTVCKYNRLLSEMKLLYIANSGCLSSNFYCQYKYKEALDEYLSGIASNENIKINSYNNNLVEVM